ncbi:MAG: YitT family protein [Clostridiales bacterium]|mgnify:FL=1|nr:YitT family protein [Clostridiales bacterium]
MIKSKKYKFKQILKEMIETILGALIMAAGVSLFLLPNQLSSGGIAGVATIFYYLLNIPMGTVIIAINIPLFLFSMYKVGKMFFLKSTLGTVAMSVFIDLLDKIEPLTNDRFLACIYGGILLGLGTTLLLKAESSTGGSDLISYIAKKYKPTVRSGNIIVIIDIIIIALNVIFFKEIEIGLYSAIAIYIMGKIIDIFFEGINFTKLMIIVSNKSEEIAKQIDQKVARGSTGLYGKGMYTNENKLILMCAAYRKDVARIKIIAKEIDPKSFIVITNSREVVGQGFKN